MQHLIPTKDRLALNFFLFNTSKCNWQFSAPVPPPTSWRSPIFPPRSSSGRSPLCQRWTELPIHRRSGKLRIGQRIRVRVSGFGFRQGHLERSGFDFQARPERLFGRGEEQRQVAAQVNLNIWKSCWSCDRLDSCYLCLFKFCLYRVIKRNRSCWFFLSASITFYSTIILW